MKSELNELKKKRDALSLALERGGLPFAAAEHVRRELISTRAKIEVIERSALNA